MYKPISGVPYVLSQRPGGKQAIVCTLGGMVSREYLFDSMTPGSQDAAFRAFDEHAIELRQRIETNLGRRLTERELLRGLEHAEDEDPSTRIRVKQEREAVFTPPDTVEPNPFKRALAAHKADQRRERDPRAAMLEEAAERWDANEQAKQEKAKRDADPRRGKCIADAIATKLAAILDPTLPASAIRTTDHLLRLAKEGDPKAYAKETNEFREAHEQRLLEQSAPVRETFLNWAGRLRQAQTRFELPAAPVEYAQEPPIDPAAEAKRLGIDPSPIAPQQ